MNFLLHVEDFFAKKFVLDFRPSSQKLGCHKDSKTQFLLFFWSALFWFGILYPSNAFAKESSGWNLGVSTLFTEAERIRSTF
jgi:hypothetical protein